MTGETEEILCCFVGCSERSEFRCESRCDGWFMFAVVECGKGGGISITAGDPYCQCHDDYCEPLLALRFGFLCPEHAEHFRALSPAKYLPPLIGVYRDPL